MVTIVVLGLAQIVVARRIAKFERQMVLKWNKTIEYIRINLIQNVVRVNRNTAEIGFSHSNDQASAMHTACAHKRRFGAITTTYTFLKLLG